LIVSKINSIPEGMVIFKSLEDGSDSAIYMISSRSDLVGSTVYKENVGLLDLS
jgi:hypothetical protein